jgi:3-deoxy-D-arabino-heptulosonate 7-phosphate (DAHP) synthase
MAIEELTSVITLVQLADIGIDVGAVGVIVSVFDDPDEAYEVEFCDKDGHFVAQATLRREDFKVL